MKKLSILFLLLFGYATGYSQFFKISQDVVFRNAEGEVLPLALSGGLNQPQFSQVDLNGDGFQDIFVFDRTGNKILTFIAKNDKGNASYFYDPSFEEYFLEGVEFMEFKDYNGDGKADLWMYDKKASGVLLYKNTSGSNGFELTRVKKLKAYNFGNPPFDSSQFNLFSGSYPDIVDIDGDGDIDYVTNISPIGSNITLYLNNSEEYDLSLENIDFEIPTYCLGGLGEGSGDVILNAHCDYHNYYRWKKKHLSNKTLGFFDNDGDGDMDLFLGTSERLTNPIYFIENGRTDLGMSKDTFIRIDTVYFPDVIERQIPVAASSFFVDVDLDGIKDLIFSTNETWIDSNSRIKETENVLYFRNEGTNSIPDFVFQQNDFIVGDMVDHGAYTSPVFVDIDNDGDMDLVIATNGDNYKNRYDDYSLVLYENIGSTSHPQFQLADTDFAGIKGMRLRQIRPAFTDIDDDGDQDLFVGTIKGDISFFRNEGSASVASFSFETHNYESINVGTSASPYFYDLNGDSLPDLLIGEYDGNINYYENTGTASSASFTLVEDTLGGILVNEWLIQRFFDNIRGFYDSSVRNYFGYSSLGIGKIGNGKNAIITGGADGKIRVFEINDDLNANFTEKEDFIYHPALEINYSKDWGAMTQPAVADINNDGYADVIIGNNRGGLHYIQGTKDTTGGVGYSDLQLTKFNVYPNPSSGILNLKFDRPIYEFDYTIHDITGREVQTSSKIRKHSIILNEQIGDGVYYLNIKSGDINFRAGKFILIK